MLTRIDQNVAQREEAQRRVEQFAADAAHELRTRVTAILGYAELCRAVAADSRAVDPSHPVSLMTQDSPPAFARRDRVTQIVANLLENVRSHTPTGTSTTVTVEGPDDEGRVALVVSDDGPGIAAEHRPHVFDRFYRADSARTRDHVSGGGSGLGLAIVRALARVNGGDAELVDAPGPGTSVRVTLPTTAAVPVLVAGNV